MGWLTGPFPPHSAMWSTELTVMVALSNVPIIVSYFALGLVLARIRSQTQEANFIRIAGNFIFWCGATHLMMVLTLWVGDFMYWLSVFVSMICAYWTVVAVLMFYRLKPHLAAIVDHISDNHSEELDA